MHYLKVLLWLTDLSPVTDATFPFELQPTGVSCKELCLKFIANGAG